jgi:hypothetical protein
MSGTQFGALSCNGMGTPSMTTIISLSAFRNGKLKERLIKYALNGETVVIETSTGFINARKVICRNAVVEVLNACGDCLVLAYEDICNVRASQFALAPCGSMGRVLPFGVRGRKPSNTRRKS